MVLNLIASVHVAVDAFAARRVEVARAFAAEMTLRRKVWFCGQPTELDATATKKAIARRLKVTPEFVAECLAHTPETKKE